MKKCDANMRDPLLLVFDQLSLSRTYKGFVAEEKLRLYLFKKFWLEEEKEAEEQYSKALYDLLGEDEEAFTRLKEMEKVFCSIWDMRHQEKGERE